MLTQADIAVITASDRKTHTCCCHHILKFQRVPAVPAALCRHSPIMGHPVWTSTRSKPSFSCSTPSRCYSTCITLRAMAPWWAAAWRPNKLGPPPLSRSLSSRRLLPLSRIQGKQHSLYPLETTLNIAQPCVFGAFAFEKTSRTHVAAHVFKTVSLGFTYKRCGHWTHGAVKPGPASIGDLDLLATYGRRPFWAFLNHVTYPVGT